MKSVKVKMTFIQRLVVPDKTPYENIMEIAEKKLIRETCWLKKLPKDNFDSEMWDDYEKPFNPQTDKEDKL